VDALAAEIRRVDGAHSLGSGALAEALAPFVRALVAARDTDETSLRTRIAEQIRERALWARNPVEDLAFRDAVRIAEGAGS
jgi:hypothetical protein